MEIGKKLLFSNLPVNDRYKDFGKNGLKNKTMVGRLKGVALFLYHLNILMLPAGSKSQR